MAKRKTTKKELFEIIERQIRYLQYLKEYYIEPYEGEVSKKLELHNIYLTGYYVEDIRSVDFRIDELETIRIELNKYGKKRQTKK